MAAFSNGIDYTFGEDHNGPSVVVRQTKQTEEETSMLVNVALPPWKPKKAESVTGAFDLPKSFKMTRLPQLGAKEALQHDDGIIALFADALDSRRHSFVRHPMIEAGFTAEVASVHNTRLAPAMPPDAVTKFSEFVAYLESTYDLSAHQTDELVPFCDDTAPELVVLLSDDRTTGISYRSHFCFSYRSHSVFHVDRILVFLDRILVFHVDRIVFFISIGFLFFISIGFCFLV
jgi:hypothetical protein